MQNDGKSSTGVASKVRRVTRKQAASILGIGLQAITYHHDKSLHPVKDAEGRWLYDREEVERLAVVLSAKRTLKKEMTKGQIAAEVFKCFDLGVSFRDIVKRFQIEPSEVKQLRADYEADGEPQKPSPEEQIALQRKLTELEIEQMRLERMRMAQLRKHRGD